MVGFRVCWQLLLGWALLLGQPVFGDAGSSSEERSLQEAEQPVVVAEEPENSLTEEPENSLTEEPENQEPELAEPEDLPPKQEEPEQQVPVEKEPKEKKPPSDEELEEMEKEEREWLRHEKKKPCGSWLQYLQAIALGHYNKKKDVYYKQRGEATLTTLKAIGTIIHLKVLLMKTNCTKDQMPKDIHRYYMYRYFQQYPKNCEPLKGSEKECTFKLFANERSDIYHSQNQDFISEKCNLMYPYEKRHQRPRITFRS